jgi:hypothetical protein
MVQSDPPIARMTSVNWPWFANLAVSLDHNLLLVSRAKHSLRRHLG